MTKFIIFVDGSNLFGSLKKLDLRVSDYEKFFTHIIKCSINYWKGSVFGDEETIRLIRVIWYEVGSIDDWDLNDAKVQVLLRNWFDTDLNLKNRYLALAGKSGKSKPDDAWQLCFNEVKTWYLSKQSSIKNSKNFHFSIKSNTDFIDIIPSGHLKVDILNQHVTEKGIDTSLAVDMISLMDAYDVALLISGDADSIPSVEKIKNKGKQVGVIEFIKGHPPEKGGRQSSSKLKAIADFVVPIYEVDIYRDGIATRLSSQ